MLCSGIFFCPSYREMQGWAIPTSGGKAPRNILLRQDFMKYTRFYSNGIIGVYQTVTGDNTSPCGLPAVDQHRGVFGVCTTAVAAEVKDAMSTGRAPWSRSSQGTPGKVQHGATSPQQIQTLWKPKAKGSGRKEPWKERFQCGTTDLRWLRAGPTSITSLLPLLR